MADTELLYLLDRKVLPSTQPYQTIVEGEEGRVYAEKYLKGLKKVDTFPTTVVEFHAPLVLIQTLFAMQQVVYYTIPIYYCYYYGTSKFQIESMQLDSIGGTTQWNFLTGGTEYIYVQ